MSNFKVRILQLREDSYQNGLKVGRLIQHNPIWGKLESITSPEIDVASMTSVYQTFAPHLLEELGGMAEGAGISTARAAAMFSGYDVPPLTALGCSALTTRDYYVRNYDFAPDFYDGLFTLAQSGQCLATAGYNLMGIGRHDGVNESGLVAGLHYVSFDGYRTGLSPWIIVRMVLDVCGTVEEAVHMLQEIPHAACYNYSLGDADGNAAIVEASPDKVMIRRGSEALACVNHFEMEELATRNRPSIDHSLRREAYISSLDTKILTQEEAFEAFRVKPSPLFFTDYDRLFGTLHTFSYSYRDARVMTVLAQGDKVLDFNLRSWTQGKDLEEEFLVGYIEEMGQ